MEKFRKLFGGNNTGEQEDKKLSELIASLSLKSVDEIAQIITEQGDKVRQLKAKKADKQIIEQEVKVLLALKKSHSEKNSK